MRDADKVIICPVCNKYLTKAKNDLTWHKLRHKSCNKWIWFVPKANKFKIMDVPERESSSGKRFY